MRKKVYVFMFIDALGWEIVNQHRFMKKTFPHRYSADMQFGYSCTAIPTILTGEPPVKHKHLSFYYYAPHISPFKILKMMGLQFLPKKIFDRWRVRHILSKLIAKMYGYTGYFEMYSMPFDRIHYFDYIEKTDIFVKNGLAPVPNLADKLISNNIQYHISNWRLSESENISILQNTLEKEEIEFAFLYTAAMDSLLHMETKDGAKIKPKLDWYENKITHLIQTIEKHYEDYEFYILSDHGMTTLTQAIDVKKEIEHLGLLYGKHYVAVYDSTMARFWFLHKKARTIITKKLSQIPFSHVVTNAEKVKYGIDFEDDMYGEEILLMDPGYQIAPSDMGVNALPGMHGFAPEHEDSQASFLGTHAASSDIKWVGDFHKIMEDKITEIVKDR